MVFLDFFYDLKARFLSMAEEMGWGTGVGGVQRTNNKRRAEENKPKSTTWMEQL